MFPTRLPAREFFQKRQQSEKAGFCTCNMLDNQCYIRRFTIHFVVGLTGTLLSETGSICICIKILRVSRCYNTNHQITCRQQQKRQEMQSTLLPRKYFCLQITVAWFSCVIRTRCTQQIQQCVGQDETCICVSNAGRYDYCKN